MTLDRWYKIAAIVASVVVITSAIVGPSVAGLIWAIRLDFDVADLRTDVANLQSDVDRLQADMTEVKENQRLILESVNRIETALINHTHDADGRAQVTLER